MGASSRIRSISRCGSILIHKLRTFAGFCTFLIRSRLVTRSSIAGWRLDLGWTTFKVEGLGIEGAEGFEEIVAVAVAVAVGVVVAVVAAEVEVVEVVPVDDEAGNSTHFQLSYGDPEYASDR
jgi:hypothetical protein